MLTKCLAGLAALATVALTVPSAHATIVTYDFTSTLANGSFSFDDTDTTSVPSGTLSGFAAGGLAYAIPSFVFNNISVPNSYVVIYNDFNGVVSNLSISTNGSIPAVDFHSTNTNLFPGQTLATLDNLTLGEFDAFAEAIDASVRGARITSLTRVPEPPALSLTASALALLGVAAARRRKIANRAAN